MFGWEPVQRTTVEYDADGRVSGWVTVTEPEWDDEQRHWMIALAELEAEQCRDCGHSLTETTGPGAADSFVAEMAGRCWSCEAIAIASERADIPRKQLMRWKTRRRDEQ